MARTTLELEYFPVSQNVGTFYCCEVRAQTLLEICQFDFRQIRDNKGIKEFMGIQRPLKEDRVKTIRKYLGTADACFPTSIVVSVDERCATLIERDGKKFLVLKPFEDPNEPKIVVPFRAIATIIDGQHRLKAFEGTDHDWPLTVNVFVGVDEATQALIFSTVNLAQTKVNKSLVYDLFSLDKNRRPREDEPRDRCQPKFHDRESVRRYDKKVGNSDRWSIW